MTTPLASLLPNGEQQFCDANGAPYAGGSVYFYIPNTTTPKTTWIDPEQVTPNANPVVLDAAGRAVIYGSGQYRQVLKDLNGNTIWDKLTQDLISLLLGANGLAASVAALRMATSAYGVVMLQGYTNPGDGGEGFFSYVPGDTTSPDNGVTIIVDASGHRYYREVEFGLGLKTGGAVGDGATDDTSAVIAVGSAGYPITAGNGNYKLTGALTFPSELWLSGAGVQYQSTVGTGAFLPVTGSVIDGGLFTTSGSGATVVFGTGVNNAALRNATVQTAGAANRNALLVQGSGNGNLEISGNFISGVDYAVVTDSASLVNVRVVNNYISSTGGADAIEFNASNAGQYSQNLVVVGNVLATTNYKSAASGFGLGFHNASGVVALGNVSPGTVNQAYHVEGLTDCVSIGPNVSLSVRGDYLTVSQDSSGGSGTLVCVGGNSKSSGAGLGNAVVNQIYDTNGSVHVLAMATRGSGYDYGILAGKVAAYMDGIWADGCGVALIGDNGGGGTVRGSVFGTGPTGVLATSGGWMPRPYLLAAPTYWVDTTALGGNIGVSVDRGPYAEGVLATLTGSGNTAVALAGLGTLSQGDLVIRGYKVGNGMTYLVVMGRWVWNANTGTFTYTHTGVDFQGLVAYVSVTQSGGKLVLTVANSDASAENWSFSCDLDGQFYQKSGVKV